MADQNSTPSDNPHAQNAGKAEKGATPAPVPPFLSRPGGKARVDGKPSARGDGAAGGPSKPLGVAARKQGGAGVGTGPSTGPRPGTPSPAAQAPKSPRGRHATPRRSVAVPLWTLIATAAVALALVVVVIVLAARSCSTAPEQTTPSESAWTSPYDWANVKRLDNGMLAYYVDGKLASEAGVDVSEHDGEIDWAAVRASGVDFAMIRLGYRGYSQGTIALDDYFLANVKGAYDAGLKVGVYFFSQAVSAEESKEEAKYVLDTLSGLDVKLSYPIAFDEEPITDGNAARTDNLSDEQLTANALAFCQAVEEAGYDAMIYGNQHDLARLDLDGALKGYPIWYAEYETGTEPSAQVNMQIWQFSNTGSVKGITASDGQVDLNIRFLAS